MERYMLGITLQDRLRNTYIREMTKVKDIIRSVKEIKWKWAGHIARHKDNRWTKEIMNWCPIYSKRPRQRSNMRWADDISSEHCTYRVLPPPPLEMTASKKRLSINPEGINHGAATALAAGSGWQSGAPRYPIAPGSEPA